MKNKMEKLTTFVCKQKFLGRCTKECTPNFDTSHHPNNYDCSNFKGRIKTYQFEVKQNDNPNI